MPSHPDRVREQYRCPECGAITFEPHVAHVMVPAVTVQVRNPLRLGIVSSEAVEHAMK